MISKVKHILFWSVISAAFIGPGTVTVAANAGASYGLSLLWALVFSVIATIVLQEGAARLTIGSGSTLGETIAIRFGQKRNMSWVVFLSVVLGCAAYEAGNILGAVSGAQILFEVEKAPLVIAIGILGFLVLRSGNLKIISNTLGIIVAIMGVAFILASFSSGIPVTKILVSAINPNFPTGSSLLIIGLVGTTVVPYNLFLGSGISAGQTIREMRMGLIWAVLIGGIISSAVLVVGVGVEGAFSFQTLAERLEQSMGQWAYVLIGIGLLAAGFTSSVTAPLASAVTGQSIFRNSPKWQTGNQYFKITWVAVLGIGLVFGITDFKPIPVIILAQAVNGILLPFVASILWIVLNNKSTMPEAHRNTRLLNVLTGLVVFVSIFLGLNNLTRASASAVGAGNVEGLLLYILGVAFALTFYIAFLVYRERN